MLIVGPGGRLVWKQIETCDVREAMHRTEAVPIEVADLDDRRGGRRACHDAPELKLRCRACVVGYGTKQRVREDLRSSGDHRRKRARSARANDGTALDAAHRVALVGVQVMDAVTRVDGADRLGEPPEITDAEPLEER